MENKNPKLNRLQLALMIVAFLLFLTPMVLFVLGYLGMLRITVSMLLIPVLLANALFTVAFWKNIPKYNVVLLICTVVLLVILIISLIF